MARFVLFRYQDEDPNLGSLSVMFFTQAMMRNNLTNIHCNIDPLCIGTWLYYHHIVAPLCKILWLQHDRVMEVWIHIVCWVDISLVSSFMDLPCIGQ